jgi:hypothetical protein
MSKVLVEIGHVGIETFNNRIQKTHISNPTNSVLIETPKKLDQDTVTAVSLWSGIRIFL